MPAERCVPLPAAISYEQAAGMMLKGMTAQYLLRQTFKVERGNTILVHAAAGGVGLILCQWGKHLGATVIGTRRLEGQGGTGARQWRRPTPSFIAMRISRPASRKLPAASSATWSMTASARRRSRPRSIASAPRGLFASFGSSSGQVEAFNINILQTKGSLFATRPTLNHYTATRKDLLATANDLFEVVGSGKVKIPVNQKYPLKDAARAHHRTGRAGHHRFVNSDSIISDLAGNGNFDGRLPWRMGQPAAALGPHDRGHWLDRHVVLFHGARLFAQHPRAQERGCLRHRVAGPRRRLLSRREIHRRAAEAAGPSALVHVGGVSHLGDGLRPPDRPVLSPRAGLSDRSRDHAAGTVAGGCHFGRFAPRRLPGL